MLFRTAFRAVERLGVATTRAVPLAGPLRRQQTLAKFTHAPATNSTMMAAAAAFSTFAPTAAAANSGSAAVNPDFQAPPAVERVRRQFHKDDYRYERFRGIGPVGGGTRSGAHWTKEKKRPVAVPRNTWLQRKRCVAQLRPGFLIVAESFAKF